MGATADGIRMTERELALYLPGGEVAPPENPYGRLIANAGAFRALARYGGYSRLHVMSRTRADPGALAAELRVGAGGPEISTGGLLGTAAPARAGTLLYGQPYLEAPAWVRRRSRRDTDYSIVGTIFAFASSEHRPMIIGSAMAPLHEWDALICSSPSLRDTVARVFDQWEDYLAERLALPGSKVRLPRPQLPVIAFGTDTEAVAAQAADAAAGAALRSQLGIGADDAMVFYLGRLSYSDKAFPQPMFRAVQAAHERSGVRTHFVLAGWFAAGDSDRARYEEAARAYAPDVPVSFLDGNDQALIGACWAAADVFFQLSDTILETFGQALVESMAAGVPLVVSDWDGFRWIVREGEDGFLVPTLGGPAGPLGETLALLRSTTTIGYGQYTGGVAAHTAASVERAAEALALLLGSPELRARMGAACRTRAREVFDWSVVAGQYLELFDELAELRSAAPAGAVDGRRMDPLQGDPFWDFRALPTEVLGDATVLRLATGAGGVAPDLPATALDAIFPGLRGTDHEAAAVLAALSVGPLTLGEVLADVPPQRRAFVRGSVMWLAKAGLVDWLPEGE